jgi:katanin p80 WD40 repeat-containing subunit B1
LLTDLKGHTASVNKLEFHPNEFLLATGSSDKTIKFWDLEKMELVSTSPINTGPIKTILFESNGKCLFAGSLDYLHSYSWEPAICHDSVYCQWKQVHDLVCVQNKLVSIRS